ncbi:hypothetical protein [Methylomonas sp. AM2-LC]|uniref:hypothetical protein n=1 Tax=Methylomonas sp. AM2-LC TaxID=3153301 RepID=UPI0032644651
MKLIANRSFREMQAAAVAAADTSHLTPPDLSHLNYYDKTAIENAKFISRRAGQGSYLFRDATPPTFCNVGVIDVTKPFLAEWLKAEDTRRVEIGFLPRYPDFSLSC